MNIIVRTRIVVSSLAFLTCLVTLLFIAVLAFRQRMLSTFVGRMKLYITTVALLLSLVYLFQVLPITTGELHTNSTSSLLSSSQTPSRIRTKSVEWDTVCQMVAGVIQYTSWVMLLLIGWLVFLLLLYTKTLTVTPRTSPPHFSNLVVSGSHRKELLAVVLTLIFPLLLLWVPYATRNYGLSSRWCGITLHGKRCSEYSGDHSIPNAGLIYLIVLWYTPSVIISLMCTFGLVIIIRRFRAYYETHGFSGHTCSVVIKGIPPITYLIIYNAINIFNMTEMIVYSCTEDRDLRYCLSVAHAVSGPCRSLAIPFTFVLSQAIIYRCFKLRKSYMPLI